MSRKKTPTVAEPTNRPVLLGFLILAAGGYSTWYWYKPLPDMSQSVSSSPWEQDRSAEWNWTDSAVLRPTLEELQSTTTGNEIANSSTPSASTFGNAPPPDLPRTGNGLVAAPNIKWQLNTETLQEPLPKSPDIHIPEEAIVGTVKPWVDYDSLSESSVADANYRWPTKPSSAEEPNNAIVRNTPSTRAVLSSGTLEQPWTVTTPTPNSPQQSTDSFPSVSHPNSTFGFGPPTLLDTNSKKITVNDDDGIPPLPRSSAPTEFTASPKRTPQFIRQPK
ncbi:MAG: hypothetical protein MUC83_13120 [Pirellula sp.]|jgi:hypothetical protein|nr:hypothetical protein [Pirellula sp.]